MESDDDVNGGGEDRDSDNSDGDSDGDDGSGDDGPAPEPDPPEPPADNGNGSEKESTSSSSDSNSSSSSTDSSSRSGGALSGIVEAERKGKRREHLVWPNYWWGNVRFTRKDVVARDGTERPAWQATCPFCEAVGKTACTRTLTVEGDDTAVDGVADVICRRRLRLWVVQGNRIRNKQRHQEWEKNWRRNFPTIDAMIPNDDLLEQLRDASHS